MKKEQGWLEIRGDETKALDWPIDSDSHVLEIGGYQGRWAMDMFAKYRCNIDIFEPQPWATTKIQHLFRDSIYTEEEIEKVQLYKVALWHRYAKMNLYDAETDGGTLVKGGREPENDKPILVVQAVDAFDFLRRRQYDVVLMNIEGGEYTLMPYFIYTGLIKQFKFIWMQAHAFEDPSGEKGREIATRMMPTHDIYWIHGSFTCWRRKDENI